MKSTFNSDIAFRPTPQTCFPPLDPQSDPGNIPCGNFRWSQFVLLDAKIEIQQLGPPPNYGISATLSNMCDINLSPGQHQFTTKMSGAKIDDFTAGCRCVAQGAGADGWWDYWSMRWTEPDGITRSTSEAWSPRTPTLQTDATGNVTVHFARGQHVSTGLPPWYIISVEPTYGSLPSMPLSRPPNPMIPLART